MKIKPTKKITAALIAALLGITGVVSAETENTNINVNVNDNEGKVIIVKGIDGESKTIEESFTLKAGDDVDAIVADLLEKHGVEHKDGIKTHKTTKRLDHHGKDLVWVQKNNDVNVNLEDGKATVTIIKDNDGEVETIVEVIEVEEGADISTIIDDLMAEHGIDAGEAQAHRKVIKLDKRFTHIKDDKPRMGFMASVDDDGWKVISVVPDSGAAEAGLEKDDLIIRIDGQSTAKNGLGLTELIAMDKSPGEISELVILRGTDELTLDVAAKVINSPDILLQMNTDRKWFTQSGDGLSFDAEGFNEAFDRLQIDVDYLDKIIDDFGDRDIRVVTTADAGAYFFSNSRMDQWLGKNHHFSTITAGLGKYFGTSKGVLVLEVDEHNKLGLKDGDVIQAINGQDVNAPKDVVRIMSEFKAGESFEVEIIREKETIYLES